MKYFKHESKSEAITVQEMADFFNKLVNEGLGDVPVSTYDWDVGKIVADDTGVELRMKQVEVSAMKYKKPRMYSVKQEHRPDQMPMKRWHTFMNLRHMMFWKHHRLYTGLTHKDLMWPHYWEEIDWSEPLCRQKENSRAYHVA